MNRYLYVLVLFSLCLGCEETEIIQTSNKFATLTVNWQHAFNGNSFEKENARVYLYDSEKEYKSLNGKAVASKSLSDIYPPHGGLITEVNSVSFDSLQPIKYWIKIFNSYNHERLVDFNADSECKLQYPLIENTHTTVTIPTKRVYIRSFTILKVEIYDIPTWINSKIGDKVELNLSEVFPFGYAADDVLRDSRLVTLNNSFISYEPRNARISSFNSWWHDPTYYVYLSTPGSVYKTGYEIKIFDLLNSNVHFGNEFIQLNDQNKIKYKLYVSWDIK